MRVLAVPSALVLMATLALAAPALAATDGGADGGLVERTVDAVREVHSDPEAAASEPGAVAQSILDPPPPEGDRGAPPPKADEPGFADRVRDSFQGAMLLVGVTGTVATILALGGFAFVTRYISPKEALKNPQRAMLYGYVRGHPGVHLKQLSEEFAMKTSSILWHIRKLESAELVRSERANGYRVFYPVAGGIEIKRVSRAITALHNRNACTIFESLQASPGSTVRNIAERLGLHGGTVRWHLRKLREFGLVEELLRDDGSRFYGTPLGNQALETLQGAPVDPPRSVRQGAPVPVPE